MTDLVTSKTEETLLPSIIDQYGTEPSKNMLYLQIGDKNSLNGSIGHNE